MLALAGILVLSVTGQALAAPRAVITLGVNPKHASSPRPSPIRTAVTVDGKPIDVIAHSPEDVEDLVKKINEICHSSDKQHYPELCGNQPSVQETKIGESTKTSQKAGKNPSGPAKTTYSKMLPKLKTTKKAIGIMPTTQAKQTSEKKTVYPPSFKPSSLPNKKTPPASTVGKADSTKTTRTTKITAQPSRSVQQQPKSSKKGTQSTGGKRKTLKPTSKTPLSSSASRKPTAVSPSSGKKSSLPPRTSKPGPTPSKMSSTIAVWSTMSAISAAKSGEGPGPATIRTTATPSTGLAAAGTRLSHTVSSHKPLVNGTYVGKKNSTSAFAKGKFWPFWNSTKFSGKPSAPMPLKQTLVTGEMSLTTTFQTVTVPMPKVHMGSRDGMIIEEYWDKQVVDGKTQGYWATKTVRSYAAPTLVGQAEDDDSMPDFQIEDLEALGSDEIEFLSENGWKIIKRDAVTQEGIQAPHWSNGTLAKLDDQRGEEGVEKGGVTETKAEATLFVPQPTRCTVSVPVVGGLLNFGRILKTFTSTTTVTRTYECGSCGPTAEIVTFNAGGKGPVVLPATKTVTAKDAFTEVVRVCSTLATTATTAP
ncbi:hypothetical protein GQ53DRAFT_849882 [Thozetella sp. PMI_491]|nr:hypothetical protein GQ53DRAFT_849882 [Thozetella sp. PMI_491]